MLKQNRGMFFQKVIDLRTADMLVYDKEKGTIVINEPLMAALRESERGKSSTVDYFDSGTSPSPS